MALEVSGALAERIKTNSRLKASLANDDMTRCVARPPFHAPATNPSGGGRDAYIGKETRILAKISRQSTAEDRAPTGRAVDEDFLPLAASDAGAASTCAHFADFRKEDFKAFKVLHQVFVVSCDHDSKIAKLKNAFCHSCKQIGPQLHACIQCVFFGCHKHIRDHCKSKKHCFSMELNYGQLHCIRCNDYVYNSGLDKIAFDNTMIAKKCTKRVLTWNASLDPDVENSNAKRICITRDSARGLRGLLNMGNTCYVNCIVQILMHTPLLREYFLSERHKCKGTPGTCVVCELSRLFQGFYNSQGMPLALNKLIHLMWIRDPLLAGKQQQDVHHFFVAILDALHQDFQQAISVSKCACIIDQIFGGLVQSVVVCNTCSLKSTKIDPLWAISLEVGQLTGDKRQWSLDDCLKQFTSIEVMEIQMTEEGEEGFICLNCQTPQESTKQLTVKTLPIVLCFHLKRTCFYSNKKINTKIVFPEMLDMTPYTSMHKESLYSVIPADNRYSLFAVVNHSGSASLGHYISYVRPQRDLWCKCDDERISRATIDQVLDAEGYLLFYHKHILSYD